MTNDTDLEGIADRLLKQARGPYYDNNIQSRREIEERDKNRDLLPGVTRERLIFALQIVPHKAMGLTDLCRAIVNALKVVDAAIEQARREERLKLT